MDLVRYCIVVKLNVPRTLLVRGETLKFHHITEPSDRPSKQPNRNKLACVGRACTNGIEREVTEFKGQRMAKSTPTHPEYLHPTRDPFSDPDYPGPNKIRLVSIKSRDLTEHDSKCDVRIGIVDVYTGVNPEILALVYRPTDLADGRVDTAGADPASNWRRISSAAIAHRFSRTAFRRILHSHYANLPTTYQHRTDTSYAHTYIQRKNLGRSSSNSTSLCLARNLSSQSTYNTAKARCVILASSVGNTSEPETHSIHEEPRSKSHKAHQQTNGQTDWRTLSYVSQSGKCS
ncbi:hypothetical protein CBL_04661 [Carabus blaptoides fortunei]